MINKEIGGGGGITSHIEQEYRQVLLAGTSNTVKDGNYTITYSDDGNNYGQDNTQPFCGIGFDTDKVWQTNSTPFPHYWQVDLGRIISRVFRFSFNPVDDVVSVMVKNYECQYSLNGVNFNTLKSGLYIPKSTVISYTWQAEIVEFNPTDLRYFRIVFKDSYDTRGYSWTGFRNALLYAINVCLYLKESDNNIYGSVDNEITQITTLDTWNNSSIEEKKNFFSVANNVLSIDQLKSLGKFKVLNEPKN